MFGKAGAKRKKIGKGGKGFSKMPKGFAYRYFLLILNK